MSQPSKRLVVLFDGTCNTPKDRTNVWRTHELLADKDINDVVQKRLYIPGVGTEVAGIVTGSIFGKGIADKICEGYQWLASEYVEGAEIYVFGFSRGAFSARSLVQLLANCGLATEATLKNWPVRKIFDRYEAISRQETEDIRPLWRLRRWGRHPKEAPPNWKPDKQESQLQDPSKVREVKIRMAGLWDTVGAIGPDALENQHSRNAKSAAHNVRPTKAQDFGYHALALDEHRPMFDATLWRTFVKEGDDKKVIKDYAERYEQRWFIGAHSDVGGGYGDDDLPDLSLQWMMTKAESVGLAFTHRVEARAGAWHDTIHDSFKSFAGGVLNIWDNVLPGRQRNYRKVGRSSKPFTTQRGVSGHLYSINETLDESVLLRLIEDSTYRPPGLIDYLRSLQAEDPQFLNNLLSQFIPSSDDRGPIIGRIFAQRTQRIYACQYWNATGVLLNREQRYRLKVVEGVGEPLRDAKYLSPTIDGLEWNSTPHKAGALLKSKRKDDAKWFALIGTVDKKNPWIVKDGAEFIAQATGQLYCYFNDVQFEPYYRNNSGWIVMELESI